MTDLDITPGEWVVEPAEDWHGGYRLQIAAAEQTDWVDEPYQDSDGPRWSRRSGSGR